MSLKAVSLVFGVGVSIGGGCFSPEPSLVIAFCYATDELDEGGLATDSLEASHTLVTRQEFDEVDLPSAFAECAASLAAKSVWVDEEGVRVYLAAHLGDPDRPRGGDLFENLEGAQLRVFAPSRQERALTLSRGQDPVLGVFKSVPLSTLAFSGLDVWLEFPSTLPNVQPCGADVEIALVVSGDDVPPKTIPNGAVEEVVVGGRPLAITNVRSTGVVASNDRGGWCPEEPDLDRLRWFLTSSPE